MRAGACDDRLRRYCSWEGAVNDSPSVLRVGGMVVRRNRAANPKPVSAVRYGKANNAVVTFDGSLLVTCSPGVRDSGVSLNAGILALPGTYEIISVEVEAVTDCQLRLNIQGSGAVQATTADSPPLAAGAVHRLVGAYTGTAAGGPIYPYVLRWNAAGSEVFKVRKLCIGAPIYFDGDTTGRALLGIWP